MARIAIPSSESLPPGPRRDLVDALHGLHRGAGKPSLREISDGIRKRQDLPAPVSHDTVSQLLRGVAVPAWARMESVVRYLAEAAVGRQKPDPEAEVERFHRLWLAVEDAAPAAPDSPAQEAPEEPTRPAPEDADLGAELRHPESDRRIAALYRLERLAWHTRRQDEVPVSPRWPSLLADFLRRARPLEGPLGSAPAPPEEAQVAALVLGRLPYEYFADGIDLSRLDLRNLVWDGARLWSADLSGSLLANGSLQHAQLEDARLAQATLTGANLESVNLTDADLTRCNLTDAAMMNARLSDANLSHTLLSRANLMGASGHRTRLTGCETAHADFSYADLRGADFRQAALMRCRFDHAVLAGADFTGATFDGNSFADADVSGARFTQRALSHMALAPAQLASVTVVPDPG
ncbi:pentapeptide repeat-containing protein [Kitasatospora sp. NPDC036755]|uniref:pentapeptide repeat-containing protein n=1 Tax=Kitasatospora sp. NPDC036755 TaxID=3154600 RepID=UPI003407AD6E